MNRTASIELNRVKKSFGPRRKKNPVLHDLNLVIGQGETFGFLGPNGAGKSTTIKLLLNFIRPDEGEITLLGHRVGKDEFRNDIGYLPEFPFFYDHLTARETLLLSGRLSGVRDSELKERIPALLARMNLADSIDRRVKGFSKGMKQRLGFANALIHDPALLIFDEPMSGMDPLGRHLIKTMMMELRQQGKTIFFSSHILSDIEFLCDQIGVIHKGRLLYSGSLDGFTQGTNILEQQFVTVINEADHASLA